MVALSVVLEGVWGCVCLCVMYIVVGRHVWLCVLAVCVIVLC